MSRVSRKTSTIFGDPSRFEITLTRYGMRVIDDSYNSNEKSFAQAVEYWVSK
jgi:UDP-N-acetylmuramyl pentapeptide synthase